MMHSVFTDERENPNADVHRETENGVAEKTKIPINNIAGSNPPTGNISMWTSNCLDKTTAAPLQYRA